MADVKISQLGNASSLTGTELVPVVQGGVTVQTTAQDIADLNTATGTVTSVAVSGTDGIQVDSGSPITTSGTIQLGIDKAALLAHINVADGAEVNVNSDWNAVSGDAQILNKPTAVSAFTNDAGYLTSYTETDPIFSAHPAHNITSTNLTEWAAAYNDKINSASFNTADGVLTLTQQDGGSVTVDLDGRYLTSETDSQTLSWNGATGEISISNGNTIDIDGRYLTSYTETDPVVGAVSGIVKANGLGAISAAVAGTDYVAPAAIANMLETSDIGVTVQGYSAVLAGTTASFTTADETKLDGIEAGAEVNVNADWNAVSGDAQILNKPTLATVATSGSYNDLSDKPTIPAAYTNSDVDAHLNTSTATTGEVLSWNGTDYDWTTPPAGYSNSDVDAHLNTSTATTNQVLSWTGTDYDWVDQSGGGASYQLYAENPSSPTAPSATGANAVAIGSGAVASGSSGRGVAIGYLSTASSTLGSTAIGYTAQAVIGNYAMALGRSRASGADSFAANIASNSSSYGATGANSFSLGYLSRATAADSFAIGDRAVSTNSGAVSIGTLASCTDAFSVSLGYDSKTTAQYAVSIGGRDCLSAANYALSSGYQSVADKTGKCAHASGQFSARGDAQTGTFVLRSDTTDATAEALTADNATPSATNQIILPNNSAYAFSGIIVARQQASQGTASAAWKVEGLIRREGSAGTTVLVNSALTVIDNTPGWTLALSADTTNGGLAITATGAAATNIRWVATINTSEVTY